MSRARGRAGSDRAQGREGASRARPPCTPSNPDAPRGGGRIPSLVRAAPMQFFSSQPPSSSIHPHTRAAEYTRSRALHSPAARRGVLLYPAVLDRQPDSPPRHGRLGWLRLPPSLTPSSSCSGDRLVMSISSSVRNFWSQQVI